MKFSSKYRYLLAAGAIFTALATVPAATTAHAQVYASMEIGVAPPGIPYYEQPICPGDGYIWTPGYWAWGDDGYYWVDGQWVLPPYVGALWTPGWWGYGPAGYFWNAGYWGPTVGYYGGINYGFGYFGTGFYGGYWNSGRFFYNRPYGRFGEGFRGAFYDRRYNGFDGRPGGPAFNSHPPIQYIGRNGHNGGFYQGTDRGNGFHGQRPYTIAGADRGNGYVSRGGFGQNNYPQGQKSNGQNAYPQRGFSQGYAQGGAYNRGNYQTTYSAPQPYAGGGRFGGAPATVQQRAYAGNYGGGNAYSGARSYSAPSYGGGHAYAAPSGGFGGGGRMSAPSGGFSGGGGGGFHGGAGGFSGGGGGGFHGGGGHR